MAFHTLSPVPTDGGTFSHQTKNFAWDKIDDNRYLITYCQVNPIRIFAQVVTMNGTAAPTYGPAYSIVSPLQIADIDWRNNGKTLYLRCVVGKYTVTVTNTRAFVSFKATKGSISYDFADISGQSRIDVVPLLINGNEITVAGNPESITGNASYLVRGADYDLYSYVSPNTTMYVAAKGRYDPSAQGAVCWRSYTSWTDVSNSSSWVNAGISIQGGRSIRSVKPFHSPTTTHTGTLDNYHWLSGNGSDDQFRLSYEANHSSGTTSLAYNSNKSWYTGTRSGNDIAQSAAVIYDTGAVSAKDPSDTNTFSMWTSKNTVFTASSIITTIYDQQYSNGVILPGSDSNTEIAQIIPLDKEHCMFIQRNVTLGGSAKIWISRFTFGEITMDAIQNVNHPFTVTNTPTDAWGQISHSDCYSHSGIGISMPFQDIADYDATTGTVRLIGIMSSDGTPGGTPVIGFKFIKP